MIEGPGSESGQMHAAVITAPYLNFVFSHSEPTSFRLTSNRRIYKGRRASSPAPRALAAGRAPWRPATASRHVLFPSEANRFTLSSALTADRSPGSEKQLARRCFSSTRWQPGASPKPRLRLFRRSLGRRPPRARFLHGFRSPQCLTPSGTFKVTATFSSGDKVEWKWWPGGRLGRKAGNRRRSCGAMRS
ncbi:hypothetical protein MPTK2_4g20700 [Marchantia polymorpha subsp. ruderalis]